MQSNYIYLDNNATTLLDQAIAGRMQAIGQQRLANPASQHTSGRAAKRVLENAREQLLRLVKAIHTGSHADQLYFTSGGTEANNLALLGLTSRLPGEVIVSAIEHPSVLAAAEHLERHGRTVRKLPVTASGVIQLEILEQWLQQSDDLPSDQMHEKIALVSVMAANNETGALQPIADIGRLCRKFHVLFHTDAVQALGKIDVTFSDSQCDAMTISAHKLHGPVGVGALIVRNGITLQPQMHGGFQQLGIRPGSESIILADAFSYAASLAIEHIEEQRSRVKGLRQRFETRIREKIPNVIIHAEATTRLPNTSCLSFPGCNRQSLQMALDLAGLACSTGSACASGSSQPSHVIEAMHADPQILDSTLRFSLSRETTQADIDAAADIVIRVVSRLSATRGGQ